MFAAVAKSLTINFENTISKSSFLKGWQCKKYLWYHRKFPLIKEQFDEQREIFRQIDAPLYQQAYKLFNSGKFANTKRNETESDWENAILRTKELLASNTEVIYRAAFYSNSALCDVDILIKHPTGYEMVLLKTATRFSENNLRGAAYQYSVIKQSGLNLKKVSVLLLNKKYTRKGEVDARQLFRTLDVTKKVRALQLEINNHKQELVAVLNKSKEPKVALGPHCTEPHDCNYRFKCWKSIPKNSVFELVGFSKLGMFDLWNRGYKTIDQIPESQLLAHDQQIQANNKTQILKPELKQFLSKIEYPVLFIDFEGYIPAIPPFDQSKPFELLPFLFAGAILKSANSTVEYVHYITHPKEDPRGAFTSEFLKLAQQVNTILVYDPITEKNILKSLKRFQPELENELTHAINKIIDLSTPIKSKAFYLPKMRGFSGMKYVLPAIDFKLNYNDLDIKTGRQAATTYQVLTQSNNPMNVEKTLAELVEYCTRDSVGLVKVFKAIEEAVK